MKVSKKIVAIISMVTIIIFLFATMNHAQQPTQMVTSKGMASVFANDVALARDQAVDDALRNAVEQTLGTFIQSSTLVQNNMVVEDNILSWSNGYVKTYRIVSENQTDPSTYEVTIEATVELANLKNDWESVQNLISRMGNPRLMFIIDEQNIGESRNQYDYLSVDVNITETTLLDKFIEKGFECVDPSTVRENLKQEQAAAILQGDMKLASTLAKKLGAEVVITGKAVAKVATGINLGGMKSCQANVTARAIKADVATVIATSSQQAAYPHIDEVTGGTEAIKKATIKLSDDLITKITQKWKDEFYKATTVKVVLQGVDSFDQVTDFASTLKYLIRGVKDIYTRDVSGDMAELDVRITGNANQLARELGRKDLDKFKVKVVGLTMNKLTVKLLNEVQPE